MHTCSISVSSPKVTSSKGQWHGLVGTSAAGHITATHHLYIAVGVDDACNVDGYCIDLNMRTLRLTLAYYVLR
jgi:hypothetical protein